MSIPLSLYIHIPWCIKKCPYCDFNSHALLNPLPEKQYLQCLIEDLTQDLLYVQNRPLVSIFFGGGTPSLISPAGIESLLTRIQNMVKFTENIEITLETNPGTVEHHSLADYQHAGINRISLGAQSFNDHMLQKLGRIHCATDTLRVVDQLHALNFRSFNIDIMHSLPKQTIEEAMQDLQTAIDLQAPHISWYQLTIEPNTFFAKYPPQLPNDDIAWKIQTLGNARLQQAKLAQYEVSAFAKSNHQCIHNLNYWNFGDYIGIGAGAHGKITMFDTKKIIRTWKTRIPKDYLQRDGQYLAGNKTISTAELPFEFMLNQLRLQQSFSLQHFSTRTGLPAASITDILKEAVDRKLLLQHQDVIQTTELGRRFLNDLMQMFLMDEVTND